MPRPWAEVAADPNFTALSPDAQEAARQAYFQQNVLPRMPQGADPAAIKAQFDQQTALKPAPPPRMEPGSESDFIAAGGGAGLHIATGQAENAAASLASKPGQFVNAATDLISGGAIPRIPDVPTGQAGRDASAAMAPALAAPAQAVSAIDRSLGDSYGADLVRHTFRVGGDALTLAGGVSALKYLEGTGIKVLPGNAPLWARANMRSPAEMDGYGIGLRNGRNQSAALNMAGADARTTLINNNNDVGAAVAHAVSGVPHDIPLDYQELDKALIAPESVYQRVAAGIPHGDAVLRTLSQARHDGFAALKSDSPDAIAQGRKLLAQADGIEDFLEKQIKPESGTTLEQFQAARKAIAQNRAVYDSLQGNDIDLRHLGRMYQASPKMFEGTPLGIVAKWAVMPENGPVVSGRIGPAGDMTIRQGTAKTVSGFKLNNPGTYPAVASVTGLPQKALVRGGGAERAKALFPGRDDSMFAPIYTNAQRGLDLQDSIMQGPTGGRVGQQPAAPAPRIPAPPLENTQGSAFDPYQRPLL